MSRGVSAAVSLGVGAVGLADHLELDQPGVGSRDLIEVGANAVGPVIVLEDLEAGVLLLLGQLGRRDALAVGPEGQVDSLLLNRLALRRVQHQNDADTASDLFSRDDLESLVGESVRRSGVDCGLVHLQARARRPGLRLRRRVPCLGTDRPTHGGDECERKGCCQGSTTNPHGSPSRRAFPAATSEAGPRPERTSPHAIRQAQRAM